MTEATLDDRGRLTVLKELRERYGDRYRIVSSDATYEGFAPRLDLRNADDG